MAQMRIQKPKFGYGNVGQTRLAQYLQKKIQPT